MKLLCTTLLVVVALAYQASPATAQISKARLKAKLKDDAVKGAWIYDDIDAGFAKAKATGKPLLVVFRCVP